MREVRQAVQEGTIALPPRIEERRREASASLTDVRRDGVAPDGSGRDTFPSDALTRGSRHGELTALVQRAEDAGRRWSLQEFGFPSRIPLIGFLISAFRKSWNNVAAHWYVKYALDQQMSFNATTADVVTGTARSLLDVDDRLSATGAAVAALHERQGQLSREFEQLVASLRASEDEARRSLQQSAQEARALHRVVDEQSDRLHELRAALNARSAEFQGVRAVVDGHGAEIHALREGIDRHDTEARSIRDAQDQQATSTLLVRGGLDQATTELRALHDLVGHQGVDLAALRLELRETRERYHELQRAYTGLVMTLADRLGVERSSRDAPPALPDGHAASPPAAALEYAAFSSEFGAPESLIQSLYEPYVELFTGSEPVLDLGCGRGTFLAMLRDHGVEGYGVDSDEHLVRVCLGRGLRAVCADGIAHLESLHDESLGGIFIGHVVEHLDLDQKLRLLKLCAAKLQRGKQLVFETPNTKSFWVLRDGYFRDPFHTMPMHPETYRFLVLAAGFRFATERYGYPAPEGILLKELEGTEDDGYVSLLNENFRRLNEFLFGFHNLTIVAQK